jgi:hypothetical protein
MSHSQVLSKENVMRSGWLNEEARSHMKNISTLHHRYQQLSTQSTEAVTANKISCKQARQKLFQEIGTLYASFDKNVPSDFYDDLCFQQIENFREGFFSAYPEAQKKLGSLADAYQSRFTHCIIAINAESDQVLNSLNELERAHRLFSRQYGIELRTHHLEDVTGRVTNREVQEGVDAYLHVIEWPTYPLFQQCVELIHTRNDQAQELILSLNIFYLSINEKEPIPSYLNQDEIKKLRCDMKSLSYDELSIQEALCISKAAQLSPKAQKFVERIRYLSAESLQKDELGRIVAWTDALFPAIDKVNENIISSYETIGKYKEVFSRPHTACFLPGIDIYQKALVIGMLSERPLQLLEILLTPKPPRESFELFRKEIEKLSLSEISSFVNFAVSSKDVSEEDRRKYGLLKTKFFEYHRALFQHPLKLSLFDKQISLAERLSLIDRYHNGKYSGSTEPQQMATQGIWSSVRDFWSFLRA